MAGALRQTSFRRLSAVCVVTWGVGMPACAIGWMVITPLSLFGLAEVKHAREGAPVPIAE